MKEDYLKVILLALIAVIGMQGYYIYDLNQKKQVSSDLRVPLIMPKIDSFDKFFKESDNSFIEMERLQQEMEHNLRNFENFFQSMPSFDKFSSRWYRTPRFDMKEQDDKYVITLELPGASNNSIDVKTENGQLLVSAKIVQEKDENTTTYHRHERRMSSYKRNILLPDNADEKSLQTDYKDGLLIITIDKQ